MIGWFEEMQDKINKPNKLYDSFARKIDMPKTTLTDFLRYYCSRFYIGICT